jgi:hypothetical protein
LSCEAVIARAGLTPAGDVCLSASSRGVLDAAGLTTVDDFRDAAASSRSEAGGDDLRLVRRIERTVGGESFVSYLKWYAPRPWHREWSRWLRGRRASGAMLELQRIVRLRDLGIDVPEPLAFGEGLEFGRYRSFLLLSSMEHWPTLEEVVHTQGFSARLADVTVRRRLIDSVAALARTLHQAGIVNPSLYSRHVVIESLDADPIRVGLIDLEDLELGVRVNERRRAEDLGALALTLQREFVSLSDRGRFVRSYQQADRLDSVARRLIAAIDRFYQQNRNRQRFRHYTS